MREAGESSAPLGRRTALALIFVDDFDLTSIPSQRRGALDQRVLALLRLDVLVDLHRGRLPDVDKRSAFLLTRRQLVSHCFPRRCCRRPERPARAAPALPTTAAGDAARL